MAAAPAHALADAASATFTCERELMTYLLQIKVFDSLVI